MVLASSLLVACGEAHDGQTIKRNKINEQLKSQPLQNLQKLLSPLKHPLLLTRHHQIMILALDYFLNHRDLLGSDSTKTITLRIIIVFTTLLYWRYSVWYGLSHHTK